MNTSEERMNELTARLCNPVTKYERHALYLTGVSGYIYRGIHQEKHLFTNDEVAILMSEDEDVTVIQYDWEASLKQVNSLTKCIKDAICCLTKGLCVIQTPNERNVIQEHYEGTITRLVEMLEQQQALLSEARGRDDSISEARLSTAVRMMQGRLERVEEALGRQATYISKTGKPRATGGGSKGKGGRKAKLSKFAKELLAADSASGDEEL